MDVRGIPEEIRTVVTERTRFDFYHSDDETYSFLTAVRKRKEANGTTKYKFYLVAVQGFEDCRKDTRRMLITEDQYWTLLESRLPEPGESDGPLDPTALGVLANRDAARHRAWDLAKSLHRLAMDTGKYTHKR
jgi:hypothetical protein